MNAFMLVNSMCRARGLKPDLVRGPRKLRELVRARRDIAMAMRKEGASFPEIGRALGGRHHTTILELIGARARRHKSPQVAA